MGQFDTEDANVDDDEDGTPSIQSEDDADGTVKHGDEVEPPRRTAMRICLWMRTR